MSDIHWPWGERALMDEHGVVERLADDHRVEFWVCPLTADATYLDGARDGECSECGSGIVYRPKPFSRVAPDDSVPKICTRCAKRMMAEDTDQ